MIIPLKRRLGSIITASIAVIIAMVFILNNAEFFTLPKKYDPADKDGCIVHFIDVGQGDSAIISAGGVNILIDAGESDRGDDVLLCIKELKINKLDYVIGTHAHSDHIGGLETVLSEIEVENIILSKPPKGFTAELKAYTELMEAAKKANTKHIPAKVGDSFDIGKGRLSIIAPISNEYKNLNDLSIVTRFDFGETSFLFTGDAEAAAERDILESGANIDTDVIKIAHHGAGTSSCKEFLEAVSPEYAVIEVGIENTHGHPTPETITRLQSLDAEIYRTDLNGCITAFSDGKDISFTAKK